MGEQSNEKAQRATVAEAIAAWEAKGPTSLTVALMAEALYDVREVCDQVEANPIGWGATAVSLARTLRTRDVLVGELRSALSTPPEGSAS